MNMLVGVGRVFYEYGGGGGQSVYEYFCKGG